MVSAFTPSDLARFLQANSLRCMRTAIRTIEAFAAIIASNRVSSSELHGFAFRLIIGFLPSQSPRRAMMLHKPLLVRPVPYTVFPWKRQLG